jgi:hypothetical protein
VTDFFGGVQNIELTMKGYKLNRNLSSTSSLFAPPDDDLEGHNSPRLSPVQKPLRVQRSENNLLAVQKTESLFSSGFLLNLLAFLIGVAAMSYCT